METSEGGARGRGGGRIAVHSPFGAVGRADCTGTAKSGQAWWVVGVIHAKVSRAIERPSLAAPVQLCIACPGRIVVKQKWNKAWNTARTESRKS